MSRRLRKTEACGLRDPPDSRPLPDAVPAAVPYVYFEVQKTCTVAFASADNPSFTINCSL